MPFNVNLIERFEFPGEFTTDLRGAAGYLQRAFE
jgi:hypothetical protein